MILQTLRSRIFAVVMGVVILTTVTLTFFVQKETNQAIFKAHEANAQNLVDTLLLNIENAHQSILFHKKTSLELRKTYLKENVVLATTVIDGYYQKFVKGLLTENEARELAIQEIRRLRYDHGVGYFWINSADPVEPLVIMHPNYPEYEGRMPELPEFYKASGSGGHIFSEFAMVGRENGEGFVNYSWTKPMQDGQAAPQPKVSYVKLYEPWNWIVGSGIYIDDIEKEVEKRLAAVVKELNTTVPKMRVAQTGYMFIFNGDTYNLVHPVLAGKHSANLRNPVTGNPMTKELMDAAHSSSQVFEYLWDKPGHKGEYIFRKIVYMRYFEPLDWYIGSTMYYDEIEQPAKVLRNKIYLASAIVLLFALLVSILLARTISEPLRQLSRSVGKIREKGIEFAHIPLAGSRETRQLGSVLTSMITSLQRSEQALRQSEERFRILFSTADPTLLVEDGVFIDCNQATLDMLRLETPEQLLGTNPAHHSPQSQPGGEGSHEKWIVMVDSARKNGKVSFEWVYSRKNGGRFWAEIILTAVTFQGKSLLHCIWRDITDHKNADEELRRSEENMRITLDSIGDGVIVVDAAVSIVRMNPVAEELTGWSNNEAVGKFLPEIFKIVDAESYRQLDTPVRQVLDERTIKSLKGNVKLLCRDGREFLIANSAAPIKTVGGEVQGVVLVFRDETEKIKTEQQLIQAQKMEAIGTLAGGLAHDFNNVLAGIFGPVSILENKLETGKDISDDKLSGYVKMIRHSGERAADMVKQLLTISHRQELSFTPVDLKVSIKHVLKIAANTFDKSIEVSTQYDDDPAWMNADPTQIEQVLLNLVINSAHAMTIMRDENEQWGGRLQVSVVRVRPEKQLLELNPESTEQDYWQVSISDTGVGMDAEGLANIFTPFFTTKEKGVGTGLGLAMVYNLVKQHRGFIIPYSEPGNGTKIHLYFPTLDDAGKEPRAREGVATLPVGDGVVLVVDDEPILREIAEAMLQDCGYTVFTAEDGQAAMQIFQEHHAEIDGVILDMVMPKLSGPDAFKQMQAIDPDVNVLLTSGFKLDDRIQHLLDLGARGFLQKPYGVEDFTSSIRLLFTSV